MVRNYTIRRHIKRVKLVLKERKPCLHCPATIKYNEEKFKHVLWTNHPCKICYTFIGLKAESTYSGMNCPCHQVGQEEAVRLTLKALKEFSRKG